MSRARRPRAPALFALALAGSVLGCGAVGCSEAPADFDTHCREALGLAASECAAVAAFRLPETLPAARGNAYADDERAAGLGRAIFFDAGFARVPGVRCATCHVPAKTWQDGVAVPEVVPGAPGPRNTPTLLDAARLETPFFWDGRADSLWSQPLFAFENPIEMGSSRLHVAHRIADVPAYRETYEAVFGALPALADAARFPSDGRPGEPAFEGMSPADQDAVNRVAANVGKALEAYQRRLVSGPARLDRYLDGDFGALDATEERGLVRFVKSGCYACHSGPMLTDGGFYATSAAVDRGRAAGIETLLASPFNAEGPYFDRGAGEPLPLPLGPEDADEHAFRTPSLRHVTLTAPYGHAGTRTLADVLSTPGVLYEPGDEVVIAAFFRALEGTPPPAEWLTPP
jgi:cytochrome c peroxidase